MSLEERTLARVLASGAIGRPRVVYTDMDGTMLGRGGSFLRGPDGAPTLEAAGALLAAQGAGIEVVPLSGRKLPGLVGDARILGLYTVIGEMGGLTAYETGREVVANYGEAPREPGLAPAEIMEGHGVLDLLFRRFAGRLEPHTPWAEGRQVTHLLRGRVDIDETEALLAAEGFGWLTLVDNGRLHRPFLGLEPGEARTYHLCPRGVSKAAGIARDRKRRRLSREECVAIGDAEADLDAATEVGLVAMVRDAAEESPSLARRLAALPNAAVTDRPMNLGWAETMRALAALPPAPRPDRPEGSR